ncbi:MAG: cupin domain-containing protein [Prolixibacteraceae bacterium]|nr:cupin domain-containing protein [Prolixibacteraceae bacterium]
MDCGKNLGSKIKQIRESKQVSIKELSDCTSLEEELIKKIEEEKVVPSLAPMIKITRALGVRLGTLLDDNENLGPSVVRVGRNEKERLFISQGRKMNERLNFYSLAADKVGRNMEPFLIDIEPLKDVKTMLSSHEGEEFMYVLEGVVEINYGKDIYRLNPGDSIYLDSIVKHNVHAGDNKKARMLAVVYTPID